jgi:hypothetical protein
MKTILVCLFCIFFNTVFASAINPCLTAAYDPIKKQVELKWQNTDKSVTGFVLQRSTDSIAWQDIYSVYKAAFNRKNQEKCTDYVPVPKKLFYRLKILTDDHIAFTSALMVIIGNSLGSWIMYPVPVTDLLNLQYNGGEAIKGVISVYIQNAYGYILMRKRYSSISRILHVPVDNLGRGIYDVRIAVNDEIVWNSRFIK